MVAVVALVVSGCAQNELGRYSGYYRPTIKEPKRVRNAIVKSENYWIQREVLPEEQFPGPTPDDLRRPESDYILGPGDLIDVTVFELMSPGQPYVARQRISQTGQITFPYLGAIKCAGLTTRGLEEKLADMLEPDYLVDPQVAVFVSEYRNLDVSVINGVARPGVYPMTKQDMKLLELLAMAGGVLQLVEDYGYIIREYSPDEADLLMLEGGAPPPEEGEPAPGAEKAAGKAKAGTDEQGLPAAKPGEKPPRKTGAKTAEKKPPEIEPKAGQEKLPAEVTPKPAEKPTPVPAPAGTAEKVPAEVAPKPVEKPTPVPVPKATVEKPTPAPAPAGTAEKTPTEVAPKPVEMPTPVPAPRATVEKPTPAPAPAGTAEKVPAEVAPRPVEKPTPAPAPRATVEKPTPAPAPKATAEKPTPAPAPKSTLESKQIQEMLEKMAEGEMPAVGKIEAAEAAATGAKPAAPAEKTAAEARKPETGPKKAPEKAAKTPEEPKKTPADAGKTATTPPKEAGGEAAAKALAKDEKELGRWIWSDGKWVEVKGAAPTEAPKPAPVKPTEVVKPTEAPKPAPVKPTEVVKPTEAPKPTEVKPGETPAVAEAPTEQPLPEAGRLQMEQKLRRLGVVQGAGQLKRIIRFDVRALQAGDPTQNIVLRDGDVVTIPAPPLGDFYLAGEVARPGVYSLTGRKITLLQAVAAAGGLSAVAVPWRTEVIRRISETEEEIIYIDISKIARGEVPDFYLQPEDLIRVGTDEGAIFNAVLRNAFRATYGLGAVYDMNFADFYPWTNKALPLLNRGREARGLR